MKLGYYYIDKKTNVLYQESKEVCKNDGESIKDLRKLESLIDSNRVEAVFICNEETPTSFTLERIASEELKQEWVSKFKHNIAIKDEVHLEDFPGEYCYFVESRKRNKDNVYLIFYLFH
ncbi:hypothetical protein CN918_30730 [Priestia megaterium]|nr:hypothetical protein CN918_30730 [Priestia megaterium]